MKVTALLDWLFHTSLKGTLIPDPVSIFGKGIDAMSDLIPLTSVVTGMTITVRPGVNAASTRCLPCLSYIDPPSLCGKGRGNKGSIAL